MMTHAPDAHFRSRLRDGAVRVDALLQGALTTAGRVDASMAEAMAYTLTAPGKRIRSVLVMWCCEAVCGSVGSEAEAAATAIEMVHTYSLVHDDLPAMDDDDFRRGRATCHKVFDEATAILVGDGLLTLAFEILARDVADPALAVALVGELAAAAGPAGMVAGQMEDLRAEGGDGDAELLKRIHVNKTAKMFGCAAVMGGLCGGTDAEQREALRRYGLRIGLGFQIADDILDVCAPSEQLGKTAGKDLRAGKATYPAIVGMERSKTLAERIANEAIEAVGGFGEAGVLLRQLAVALLERTA